MSDDENSQVNASDTNGITDTQLLQECFYCNKIGNNLSDCRSSKRDLALQRSIPLMMGELDACTAKFMDRMDT